jgi:CHAT domain-containing protein
MLNHLTFDQSSAFVKQKCLAKSAVIKGEVSLDLRNFTLLQKMTDSIHAENWDNIDPDLRHRYLYLLSALYYKLRNFKALDTTITAIAQLEKTSQHVDSVPDMESLELLELRTKALLAIGKIAEALDNTGRMDDLLYFKYDFADRKTRPFDIVSSIKLLQSLSDCFQSVGLPEYALNYIRRALTYARATGDREQQWSLLLDYCDLWTEIDPYGRESADHIPEWKKQLDKLKELETSRDGSLSDRYLYVKAKGELSLGHIAQAKQFLALIKDSDFMDLSADILSLKAIIALQEGQIKEAIRLLDQSERSGNSGLQDAITKFHCYSKLGDYEKALQVGTPVFETFITRSAQNANADFQAILLGPATSFIDDFITVVYQQQKNTAGDSLLKTVIEAIIPNSVVIKTNGGDQENSLSRFAALRYIYTHIDFLQKVYPKVDLSKDEYLTDLRTEQSLYFAKITQPAAKNSPDSTIAYLKRRSLKYKEQIRLYYMGHHIGFIFVFDHGSLTRRFVLDSVHVAAVNKRIPSWDQSMTNNFMRLMPLDQELSRSIFSTLFPEGRDQLPEKMEIIPHGALWNSSFETLNCASVKSSPQYLDEIVDVQYLTPVSIANRKEASSQLFKKEGVFFVDPTFSRGTVKLNYGTLFFPELKKRNVLTANYLSGAAATKYRLHSTDTSYVQWLHFTTHSEKQSYWDQDVGLLLAKDPALVPPPGLYDAKSKTVLFSGEDFNYKGDGFLSLAEVPQITYKAKFVFLHGCQTATGAVYFSGGNLGLISPFLINKSEQVISTHWDSPNYKGLASAMADFYAAIGRGIPADEALRMMRRKLRTANDKTDASLSNTPFVWGNFSIYQ